MRWVVCCVLAGCSFEASLPTAAQSDAPPPMIDAPVQPMLDGSPVVDSDNDGIVDASDNCPTVANAGQLDEDGDQVGNVCDNCPHVANADQANVMESTPDGVGDACDPRPTQGGDTIALFLGFDEPSEITTWQSAGTNAMFQVMGGRLHQNGQTDLAILWKNGLGFTDAYITTEVTYKTLVAGEQFRGASVMTRFVRNAGSFGFGVGCGEMRDSVFMNDAPFYNLMRFDNGAFQNSFQAANATVTANHTQTYTVHRTSGNTYECRVGAQTYSASMNLAETGGSGVNLAVWGATVSFKYLVVID